MWGGGGLACGGNQRWWCRSTECHQCTLSCMRNACVLGHCGHMLFNPILVSLHVLRVLRVLLRGVIPFSVVGTWCGLAWLGPVLCTVQAVQSMKTVIAGLNEPAVAGTVLPVLRRLSNGDWFTARVSACALFGAVYARVSNPDHRTELRR